jgi:hypothetical protein
LFSEWKVLSSPLRYHFVYFSVILSIFGALVVFGTMVELILSQRTKWYKLWYLKKTPELETGSNDSETKNEHTRPKFTKRHKNEHVAQKFTDCQKNEHVTQKFTDCQKDEHVTQTFTECQSNLECYDKNEINSNRDENRLPIGYMPHAEGRMHSVSSANDETHIQRNEMYHQTALTPQNDASDSYNRKDGRLFIMKSLKISKT